MFCIFKTFFFDVFVMSRQILLLHTRSLFSILYDENVLSSSEGYQDNLVFLFLSTSNMLWVLNRSATHR